MGLLNLVNHTMIDPVHIMRRSTGLGLSQFSPINTLDQNATIRDTNSSKEIGSNATENSYCDEALKL
jgi:hypothetical protein